MYLKGIYKRSKNNDLKPILVLTLMCAVIVSGSTAEDTDAASVLRNRVFNLKHVSAANAKNLLEQLNIGTDINAMPTDKAIVFTADNAADMQKAKSILNVIDSGRRYFAAPVIIKPDADTLMSISTINGILGDVTAGTFAQPPLATDKPGVIVDMHNDDLIAVAPADMIDRIAATIRKNWEESLLAKDTTNQSNDIIKAYPAKTIAYDQKFDTVIAASDNTTAIKSKPKMKLYAESLDEPAVVKPQTESNEPKVIETIVIGDADDGSAREPAKIDKKETIETIQNTNSMHDEVQLSAADKKGSDLSDDLLAELGEKARAAIAQEQTETVSIEPYQPVEIAAVEQTETKQQTIEEKPTNSDDSDYEADERRRPAQPIEIEINKPVGFAWEDMAEEEQFDSLQPKKEGKVTIPLDMLRATEEDVANGKLSTEYDVAIPGTEEELNTVLDLPQEVEITDLLELIGKQLGLNYMYDPAKIRGKVMLKIHDGKVKVKDLYALVESVLNFKGFVMTRRDKLVTIVPKNEADTIDPVLRKDMNDIKPGDIIVGSVFQLKHIATSDAVSLLRNMKLGLSTQPIEDTKTLIVIEYAYRMPRVAELLNMVDVDGEPKKFAFRELKHTTASSLTTKVQTLAQQLGTVSISIAAEAAATPAAPTARGRTTAAARRTPTPARNTNQGKKGGADTVYLDVDDRTNRILMIGLIEDLQTVNELIDSLDVPKRDPRKIFQYEIQFVDASEVVDTLNQLGVISYGSSRTGSSTRTRTTARPNTAAANAAATNVTTVDGSDVLPGEEPQVVVLSSTNSLLINATIEQHEQIAMIIGHVDRELEDAANPYVIYRLENQDPEELSETLDQIVNATLRQRTAGGTASKDPKVQGSTASGPVTARDVEDQIVIVPDKNTFSLIVYASKKNQEQIARMIKELDKRRPQVLIDVTLVEISKDNSFKYDLQAVSAIPNLANTSGVISGVGADAISTISNALNNATDRNAFQEARVGGGTGRGFYADNHIHALLELMETKNYGRVLAQPKILVNDNEKGEINTDNTTYIAQTSQSVNTTSGDPITNTSVQFAEFTSGINLSITPTISEGDLLRLEIQLKRSQQDSAGKDAKDTPPPDRTENNINTIVTVPNNSTIILGGVNELSQNKSTGKVPVLGDVPLVGGLFQNTNNTDNQTKLYIFVKAYILRPQDNGQTVGLPQLVERSDEYKRAFEQEEKKFQDHSWGTIKKSNPMEPMKILEVK